MALERLTDDLAVISRLSDYPGAQDGLSTAEFKAKFDEASLLIQHYINEILVPTINSLSPNGEDIVACLPLSGGKMTGSINMNSKRITNLPNPSSDRDAVPRSYVLAKSGGTVTGTIYMDNNKISDLGNPTASSDAANKGYVDSAKEAAITAAGTAALPKTGGTITGDLILGDGTNAAQHDLYIRRSVGSALKSGRLYWGSDGNLRLQAASNESSFNALELRPDSTEFDKPVSIASGGTGATTPDAALSSLNGLSKAGGTMSGAINMGSKKITNLAAPTNNADAANKSYVDGYVDGKRLSGSVTLTASGWSSGVQTVTVSGILATDMPHWGIVYGTNREAEKEAFALVDELETAAGKFIFRCFGDVPAVALNIQWEVNR